MKVKQKTTKYNKNKHPNWLNNYLESFKQRTGGEINSIEEVEFKNNHNIFLSDLLPDIEKAMNKKGMLRHSIVPLRHPKYISIHKIGQMDSEDEVQVGILVRKYTENDIKTIPFSGFVIMGDNILTADETDDSTAELMIKLLELIWQNNLSKKK
jgi:hypothetical protein